MSFVKKLLSVVMAIALVATVLAIGVSAVGTASGNEFMTVTVSTNENYMPDDTVTVKINIANNYNCTAFRFPIMFDSSIYEVPAVLGFTQVGNAKTYGTIGYNNSKDGSFIPSNYNADEWGCILVQWTANIVEEKVGAINNEDGQTVLSFNLKVKSAATPGSAGTIFIPAEYDGFYYQAIEDVADATSFYYLNSETLSMTLVPANPTIIGEPIVLEKATSTATTVIDETNKYVYGLESPITAVQVFDNYLKLSGTNATLQYKPTNYGYGTGTKVNILLAGNLVTSYEAVIFGDINGDSFIDLYDLIDAYNISNSLVAPTKIQTMAYDIVNSNGSTTEGDGATDIYDLTKIYNVANSLKALNQANPYQ